MKREAVALAGTVALAVSGAVATSLTGSSDSDASSPQHTSGHHAQAHGALLRVVLRNAEGRWAGRVWMRQRGHSVVVHARLRSLSPGFHGFHVHTTGLCDPHAPDGPFMSAGGHLAAPGTTHGGHEGDLPSVLANDEGRGRLGFVTSRFSLSDLRDDDGSAVMVHQGRDNFANVPDRYVSSGSSSPGADDMTKKTGDAGDRYACAVIPAAS
jgi:superoxide dismutase, Cu-Zn family